ncbi:PspC domain-containing protein [Shewanella sp. A3A]|uniref:PspC domain-containing protein n=1 Tax=Shewanella electrica TaxID=515560 RepID=A0ABT2FMK4_9GAMM|nr:PspC domain-containing protein [Shewanella electrica]MCH1920006.1 PspC domain-containing protein [Shewanella ferrihydritica]MCH1926055.1 PspC domain-containing protein [Shewanella electrica]MCS4557576.1 PspC domain-containing protein [Shewanella electrica]
MTIAERMRQQGKLVFGSSSKLAQDFAWSVTLIRLGWIVLGIIQPVTTVLAYAIVSAVYPWIRNR